MFDQMVGRLDAHGSCAVIQGTAGRCVEGKGKRLSKLVFHWQLFVGLPVA